MIVKLFINKGVKNFYIQTIKMIRPIKTGIKRYRWKKFFYEIFPDISHWKNFIRFVCKALDMDEIYDKSDIKTAIDEWIPMFFDIISKKDFKETQLIQVQNRIYKVIIHRLWKKSDWNVWVRIICKWAKYNQEHREIEIQNVISKIIPDIIASQTEKKLSNIQIRITKQDKDKLINLAKNENLSLSDFIVKRTLAV